jgi:D-beta-D-heptose 7-phosphate kinase / D-beta-D-heptose 1-phosphate adenosyltransferase
MAAAANYFNIIDQFSSKSVLVIGDFIMDVYVKGRSNRLSPEAPVPVVDVAAKVVVPGGAANTACNLKKLGARVTFCSVTGTDELAGEGIRLMKDCGIDTRICQRPDRTTLVKTRVMVDGHVLIRFDEGTDADLNDALEHTLLETLEQEYHQYDAVLISDYNKGILTNRVVEKLLELQKVYRKFVAVDSKRLPFFCQLAPDLVKPNYGEVVRLINLPHAFAERCTTIQAAGDQLEKATKAKITAVTLDEEGSLIFCVDRFVYRALAPPVTSPQVSGAGDTYISAFMLGYLCSEEIPVAAEVATAAASIAISKNETSSCTSQELRCHFYQQQKYIRSLSSLEEICGLYRAQGKRIVFTNGCFDILHSGHVSYLNQARALGDILIVGINKDESIRRLKGPTRPLNLLEDRLQVVAGLSAVTHVVAFGEQHDDTPANLIKLVKPTYFVKGGDYTRAKLPEAGTVDAVGGEIIFIPYVSDHSTSRIIEHIQKTRTADQAAIV